MTVVEVVKPCQQAPQRGTIVYIYLMNVMNSSLSFIEYPFAFLFLGGLLSCSLFLQCKNENTTSKDSA